MSDIIKVKKIAETDLEPTLLASHAARTCYAADVPEIGETIDVENRLFKTGHHTTLEHNYYTFNIDGIPVSSVVFGLHLTAPFYNTDQRSGRFSKMYDNPDMAAIKNTLETYHPEVSGYNINAVCDFIENGLEVYAKNKNRVTELARDAIHRERPHASEKYVEQNAPKFAQEQLRMFVSMIAPTALDYTIDLATLFTLYRTAWTTEMRDAVNQMAELAMRDDPKIQYMFDPAKQAPVHNYVSKFFASAENYRGIKTRPEFTLLDYKYDDKMFVENKSPDMADTLQFHPRYMNNSLMYVDSKIHVDAGATMGQDQRHRSIQRSEPQFTGYFYLPPLLNAAGLEKDADKFMNMYYSLMADTFSRGMLLSVAPYGAMVEYNKHANLNALMHEQGKRTCWCAQEAIYHISCDLRRDLAQCIGENAKLMKYLTPPCLSMGKCPEGSRCCGRNIIADKINGYFKQRQI